MELELTNELLTNILLHLDELQLALQAQQETGQFLMFLLMVLGGIFIGCTVSIILAVMLR